MELSSIGIKLSYAESQNDSFQGLYGLRSTPSMGGEPQRIDVTNLRDTNRRTIKGVRDLGNLEFEFFYNSAETNENVSADEVATSYAVMRAYDVSGTPVWFKLEYPDGTGYKWKGTPSVRRNKADVNEAISFTLKTNMQTELMDF